MSDPTNIPNYDAELTKVSMELTTKLCEQVKNNNSDDEDWELKILKYSWTPKQQKLFNQVVRILDTDRLSRLAFAEVKKHEVVQRRIQIDKSAERMRKALANVGWDTLLSQWIHNILMENLPPSYLTAYLDIMQVLKAKLPSLVDKMIFWKPGHVNQELLAPILKKPWQIALTNKYRKLPGSAMIVVIPSASPRLGTQSSRISRLYTLFSTMAPLLPIQIPINSITTQKQSLQSIAEQTVSITRSKIQELKSENPDRRLIIVGMNSGSFVGMQVALVEQVAGVVCFGFSYNTVHGVRGQPDDYYTETSTPTMFIIGQNAARCSEEEVENFKEKISVPTSTVIVGSADDYLRMDKTKRRLEGVTQEMVDNMIVDEISEFATKCLQRPLPAKLKNLVPQNNSKIDSSLGPVRKRKPSPDAVRPTPMKSQKLMGPTSTSDEAIEMAVQSILPSETSLTDTTKIVSTSGRAVQGNSNLKMRVIQSGQPITSTKTTSKFFTVNPQKKILNNSRPSTPTNQTQQIVLKRSSQTPSSFSPTKYTIVKTSTPGSSSHSISYIAEASDVSGSSIYDMPIVFADNEGNIEEDSAANDDVISVSSGESPPHASKKVVIKSSQIIQPPHNPSPQFTITKNKNILIQKPAAGKMLMINGTVIGKPVAATNIMMPKTQLAPQPFKMQKMMSGMRIITTSAPPQEKPTVRKVEILNNQIIRPASTSNLNKSTSFINLADAKQINLNRLSLPASTTSLPPGTKNQIIHIKTNTLKLKPYTGMVSAINTKQLGNLTVKRLVPPPPNNNTQKTVKKP